MKNNKTLPSQASEWAQFTSDRKGKNFPKWPNEVMVKLIFGDYLNNKINKPDSSWKVLDVGCGFGNNLVPFMDMGCECHGVEIHPEMVSETKEILEGRGFEAELQLGSNRKLPYENDYFDLVLSINAIHYEGNEDNILMALDEFKRVLKPGGILYISTVGDNHDIKKRSKSLGNHMYEINDWDFRDGQVFYFFDNESHIVEMGKRYYTNVETAIVTEDLITVDLGFLIAVCTK